MPLDLNAHNLDSLTQEVQKLLPSQAIITSDGLVIRRRPNTIGFDCGIGRGGHGGRRFNTAGEAAEFTMSKSAAYEHPKALGGVTRFDDVDAAIESVRRGEATPAGPSPAVKALRKLASKTNMSSYRTRAQKARDFLAKGDINRAVRQLEAILEHAANHGNLKDIERAEAALADIKEHHDYTPDVPQLFHTKLEVVTHGAQHYVYKNGKPATGPLTRSEAEARRGFLAREAARAEDVQAIDNEIAGRPTLVARAEEAAA